MENWPTENCINSTKYRPDAFKTEVTAYFD